MIDTKKNFNEFIASDLNTMQQGAVSHHSGPLLIVAGAGSGKTRVITARIANLIINERVSPASIVALTFTNKAAKEMQERIRFFLGGATAIPFVGTFHAYCLRILKANAHLLSFPFISILDSDDQHKMLHGIISRNKLNKQMTAQQLASSISQVKNNQHNPDIMYSYGNNILFKQLMAAYEEEKRASKSLDFDDLLLETVALFKKYPDFATAFHKAIRHVLVDEYQDTNVVQHELLLHMSKLNKKLAIDSICVVGDEDQSIYSWRGATVANIINFKKDFEKTEIIKLEQNYRSVQPILEAANHVIKQNKNRNPKKLWSDRSASDRIATIISQSDYQEGDAICQFLSAASKKQQLSTIAILYRTHFQSRSIEEALIRASIPYKIIGGTQFYERKEIKDLLAYLRLMVNPFDRTSFFRVVNCPTRSLGEKFEELFYHRWNIEPLLGFADLSKKLIEEGVITGAKKTSLIQFISIFDSIDPLPSQALNQIITSTQYFTYLKKAYPPEEAQERIDNVKELIRALNHFERNNITTVAAFLDEVALMQEHAEKKSDTEPVSLMTLHAAKGLEFDTVILAGLEEGLLPSSRSIIDTEKLEEERRLFYVGITRAQERLLLSHCRSRYTFGQITEQMRSRFLDEIPPQLSAIQDLTKASATQLKLYFSQWLSPETKEKREATVLTFGSAAKTKEIAKRAVTPTAPSVPSAWKKNQPVKHAAFGVGTVSGIEKRENGAVFLEIKFKQGTKKIAEKFVTSL